MGHRSSLNASLQAARTEETPITQYQFDPSTLHDAFHDQPSLGLVREMVGFLYQALIYIEVTEVTEVIGAMPHSVGGEFQ